VRPREFRLGGPDRPTPVRVRELQPRDEDGLPALFDTGEGWFVTATGQPAAPGDAQSLCYSLPQGAALEDKVLLVVEADGRIVGVVDAVPRYPGPQTCSVGLFLIHPAWRRRGLGRAVSDGLLAEPTGHGIGEVLASVAEGWEPGTAFLRTLGFLLGAARDAGTANRNRGPGERPVLHGRLVVS
jgi:GNAT superfamily N-acetyltransferase